MFPKTVQILVVVLVFYNLIAAQQTNISYEDRVKGDPGDSGYPGPKGQVGSTGATGFKGQPGKVGAPGTSGSLGDPGPSGKQGNRGIQGQIGSSGDSGKAGLVGAVGVQGDKGERGNKGEQGAPGLPGINGLDGVDGVAVPGAKGDDGEMGEMGPSFDQTVNGENGDTGRNGLNGTDGQDGIAGAPGKIIWREPTSKSLPTAADPRSCYEIWKSGQTESGSFRIDPNGADSSDSLIVYCKFDNQISTCIPNKKFIEITDVVKETLWLSHFTEVLFMVKGQIQELQQMSKSATQRISYAWTPNETEIDDMNATLIGWNDVEIGSNPSNPLHFTTELWMDTAKERMVKNMTLITDRPNLLPFIDMGFKVNRNIGDEIEFLINIGGICFTH